MHLEEPTKNNGRSLGVKVFFSVGVSNLLYPVNDVTQFAHWERTGTDKITKIFKYNKNVHRK
jgi:hypothetical protein